MKLIPLDWGVDQIDIKWRIIYPVPIMMCFMKCVTVVLEEKVVTRDSHGHRQVSYQNILRDVLLKLTLKEIFIRSLKVVNQPMRGFQAGDLVKFETEVTEFNKKFKCYASSKEDGFYLLTPYIDSKNA